MGIFYEYVARGMSAEEVNAERKAQLRRLGELRKSAVLTYAARLTAMPVPAPTSIVYDDLLPFSDMLDGLSGDRIAIILETHGGIGEVGRDMVELLRERFKHVTFIVPGTAKSTGTIMVMGGDEIMMGPASSLGPIDAQLLQPDGKQYSADALLEGVRRIKEEIKATGQLSAVYIPYLQKLSPGELEHAHNALEFARKTVREWLTTYKFKDWTHHRSGVPVTDEEKKERAAQISQVLSSQVTWLTHGRSLRMPDLRALKLRITDFSEDPQLFDAIQRYHVLLRMTFNNGNIYKIFETPDAILSMRFNMPVKPAAPGLPNAPGGAAQASSAKAGVPCPHCGMEVQVQLDFASGVAKDPEAFRYPQSGELPCPNCGRPINLVQVRRQIEEQIGRPALNPQPTD